MASAAASRSEQDEFDRMTRTSEEDGLFQACMTSIRGAHIRSNRIRTGLVIAGLFTDKSMYREVLALFYVVTKALETKLGTMTKGDSNDKQQEDMLKKLQSLGYSFTPGYEKDLATLYGTTWKTSVDTLVESNEAAKTYLSKIQSMTKTEQVAGAVFILWGPLVIGGGAAAMPRVKSLCGPDAIHVFESVTGPGQQERKGQFVQVFDSLAKKGNDSFDEIVTSCQECMQGNNDLLSSLKRNPWWLNYIIVVIIAVALYFPLSRWSRA